MFSDLLGSNAIVLIYDTPANHGMEAWQAEQWSLPSDNIKFKFAQSFVRAGFVHNNMQFYDDSSRNCTTMKLLLDNVQIIRADTKFHFLM